MGQERDYLVEVCADCLCAGCVHGDTHCPGYWRVGTAKVRASDLRFMEKEDPREYSRERLAQLSGFVPIDLID